MKDTLVIGRDLMAVAALPFLSVIARGVLPPQWPRLCRLFARAVIGTGLSGGGAPTAFGAHVSRVLGPGRIPVRPETIRTCLAANHAETMLQLLRAGWARQWTPQVSLEGRRSLEAALRRGRGAILLVHQFRPFVHLPALHLAGFNVLRLSDELHGYFTKSGFGRRWLNRFQISLEQSWGCRRVIVRQGSIAHLRQVQQQLRAGGVVLMSDLHSGVKTVRASFMNGWLNFATAPFHLAASMDVPLFSVFSVSEEIGSFRVFLEGPLNLYDKSGQQRDVKSVVRDLSCQIESFALRYPEQCQEWRHISMNR